MSVDFFIPIFWNTYHLSLLVDATIKFPTGLTVAWQGKPIGNIKMNDIQVAGDVGAQLNMESEFTVADINHITAFTRVCCFIFWRSIDAKCGDLVGFARGRNLRVGDFG